MLDVAGFLDALPEEWLKLQIITVLNSPEVQGINFVAESVAVGGAHYKRVADAVAEGRIRVRTDASILRDKGYFGTYDGRGAGGVLTLVAYPFAPGGVSVFIKAAVVHECTHAAMDLMKLKTSRGLKYTEYEGMAFIAEQVYVRRLTGASNLNPGDHRMFHVADGIAQRIIAHGKGAFVVSPEDMRTLRFAVGSVRPYSGRRREVVRTDG
jgi:hypothetical protein